MNYPSVPVKGVLLREGLSEEALEAAQARVQDASIQGHTYYYTVLLIFIYTVNRTIIIKNAIFSTDYELS